MTKTPIATALALIIGWGAAAGAIPVPTLTKTTTVDLSVTNVQQDAIIARCDKPCRKRHRKQARDRNPGGF